MRLKRVVGYIGLGCMLIASCATEPLPEVTKGFERIQTFDLGQGIRLELVFLAGGSFQMGSPVGEKGRSLTDLSVQNMEVADFWIGRFEVTEEQYLVVTNPSIRFDKRLLSPKDRVRWNDVLEFCKRLSERTGWTFNLPTEAQWEYACRAGTQTRFCFGDNEQELEDYAWYEKNKSKWSELGYPQNVGQKKPNAWGLYDMHGNVWELCQNRFVNGNFIERDKKPEDKEYFEKAGLIPHVIKGGCWWDVPDNCRSASRYYKYERDADIKAGFRVVAMPPAQ